MQFNCIIMMNPPICGGTIGTPTVKQPAKEYHQNAMANIDPFLPCMHLVRDHHFPCPSLGPQGIYLHYQILYVYAWIIHRNQFTAVICRHTLNTYTPPELH